MVSRALVVATQPDWVAAHHPDWWGDNYEGVWYAAPWWYQYHPDWVREHHPDWWGDFDDHITGARRDGGGRITGLVRAKIIPTGGVTSTTSNLAARGMVVAEPGPTGCATIILTGGATSTIAEYGVPRVTGGRQSPTG